MKSSKLFLTSLLAAAAMSATVAYSAPTSLEGGASEWAYEFDASTYKTVTTKDAAAALISGSPDYFVSSHVSGSGGTLKIGGDTVTEGKVSGVVISNANGGTQSFNTNITGSGVFAVYYASNPNGTTYDFTRDVSGFSGDFFVKSVDPAGRPNTLKFSGTGMSAISGTGNITSNCKVEYAVTTGDVTVANSSLSVKNLTFRGANYTVSNAVTGYDATASNNTLTISAGTTMFNGAVSGFGNVTVASGATLAVGVTGTLDLSGARVTLGSAITNSGTVTISANTVFNLTQTGETTLISGGAISGVAWNTLTGVNFTYNGNALVGRGLTSTSAGVVVYNDSVSAKELTWNGDASGAGTWELATIGTEPANKPWKDGETDEAFYSGDSVIFDKNATVTVASGGVTAGAVNVTAGTVSFRGSAITAVGGVFVAGTSAESIATLKLTNENNFAAGTVITVGEHGVFDINAQKETTGFSLVLDGGRLTNTGTGLSGGAKNLSQGLTLTADSYIGGSDKDIYFIGNGGTADVNINLGGYTLTKDGTGTLAMCTGVITNGTLKVTNGTLKSSTGDISGKTIKLGEGGRIEVVENGVMNATIASMAAGSSLTLAGTGASTVTGTIETATLNIQNGSLTWTHDGNNRSSAASITIGSGSTFKDDANFKYTLTLSGKLSGAGRLVSGVAYDDSQGSGQGDDYRNVTLEGSTGEFTGEWQLETAGSKHPAGNRRINGILSSSDGKFGGVINFTSTSTESLPVSESKISSKLSLAKNMEIGGLKGTLSNTIVGSNNADSRALTINTVADANYDYAGTIASTISGITKTGSGTQILSGDNSAYTGTTRIEGGKLVAASANALGASTASVTVAGGQLSIGNSTTADVTLNQTAITVVLGEAYKTTAALVGENGGAFAGTVTVNATDLDALGLVAEVANVYSIWGASLETSGATLKLSDAFRTLLADAGWTSTISGGVLTISAIPEPSTFGLLAGLGALALAGTRRRRRKA